MNKECKSRMNHFFYLILKKLGEVVVPHIWSESKYDNFDIPNIPKTDPDSPKRALSDRAMG